jgi:hypothetical protein
MKVDRWRIYALTMTAAFVLLACSKKSENATRRTLTQAQRDSAIAASQLPGAGVVGRALEVSDSAKARANKPIPEP